MTGDWMESTGPQFQANCRLLQSHPTNHQSRVTGIARSEPSFPDPSQHLRAQNELHTKSKRIANHTGCGHR